MDSCSIDDVRYIVCDLARFRTEKRIGASSRLVSSTPGAVYMFSDDRKVYDNYSTPEYFSVIILTFSHHHFHLFTRLAQCLTA